MYSPILKPTSQLGVLGFIADHVTSSQPDICWLTVTFWFWPESEPDLSVSCVQINIGVEIAPGLLCLLILLN